MFFDLIIIDQLFIQYFKVLFEYTKHLCEVDYSISHSCKLVFIEIQIFMNMNVQVLLLQRECLLLMKLCELCINNSNLISQFFLFLFLFFLFLFYIVSFRVFTLVVAICFKRECLICALLMLDKRCQVGPTFLVSGILLEKKIIQRITFISKLKEKRKSIFFKKINSFSRHKTSFILNSKI